MNGPIYTITTWSYLSMGIGKVNKSIDDNCEYSFNAYYILSLKYEKYDFLAMNSLALI